ncbi:hypothetical protein A3K86_16890 [Photobacterium jeanii]|uniref:DUF2971 domain-containing protein n=1 Tax=Photobacterium jeanii TaxID=858640 RepID=A0A178K7K8_9GAMM|nr:DUF2971 domain-containing protein [Photobacterium jeanii]OAN13328.1 hypothetical protein A3K86_16890 [Photobacterium jeanii]PST90327.1 DUF2971 domain-containing protein [Photobacterium jeanii]
MRLFHYTSLSALLSVVRNQSVWLTDIRYLNDSKELHDGIERLVADVSYAQTDMFTNFDYHDKASNFVVKALTDFAEFGSSEDPLFVFSLSSQWDCLSQWRAYGSYAIEFHHDVLSSELGEIKQCIYSNETKNKISRKEVSASISDISADMGKNHGCQSVDSLDSITSLINIAATFKHNGFSEENEQRIILSSSVSSESYPSNVKFRNRGELLIPYIEKEISLDSIKSITVGPIKDQELAYQAMCEFIDGINKNWQFESNNTEFEIQVKKSKIPYRG